MNARYNIPILSAMLITATSSMCHGRIQYDVALDNLPNHVAVRHLKSIQSEASPHQHLRLFSCIRCHKGSFPERNEFGSVFEGHLSRPDTQNRKGVYPALESAIREFVLERRPEARRDAGFQKPFFLPLPWYVQPVGWLLIILGSAGGINMFRALLKHSPNQKWAFISLMICSSSFIIAVEWFSENSFPPI